MSPLRLFLASFFIGLGAFLLLERFGLLPSQWYVFGMLWPLALILLGVWVLYRKRWFGQIPVVLLGLVCACILGIVVDWIAGAGEVFRINPREEVKFSRPLSDSTTRGTFRLEAGAGTYVVEGSTDLLFDATVHASTGHFVFDAERIAESEDLRLLQEGRRSGWVFSRIGNRVRARFNPTIPWDLRIATGASRMDLDLSLLRIERITIESGVSDIHLRLGDKAPDVRCSITAGASSIRIAIPASSACELDADTPLSHKDFRGFERVAEGRYRTENFGTAEKKVFLTLEAGISSLSVTRY